MEVGVQIVGIFLRLINFLLSPLFWLASRGPKPRVPQPSPIHLRSTVDLARAVRDGEMTSEELVTAFIERVKEVNRIINAVVDERYAAALAEAREVDRQIEEAKRSGTLAELVKRKPLLGVPFTVKESCSLAGMSNSVGILENAGRRATTDGAAVKIVKEAGAIPLLVSNTPELCLGWETANLLNGTTNNPYCVSRTPSGSSGGEAALLACGASPFSVASDIAGSIRLPAAFCGVFGHKPTPGIIPIEGHIPTLNDENYPKFLTVGPMTRKAEDLPLLLNVMAGENRHKFRLDEPVDIKKLRVLYMTEATRALPLTPVDACVQDAVRAAADYLTHCGATLSQEKFDELENSVELSISVFFAMKDIPNMLQDPLDPKRQRSLIVELLKHIFGGASRSLQALGFTLIDRTNLFIPASRRKHYCQRAEALREHITRTLGTDGVFLYPVFTSPAHRHNEVFSRASGVLYTMLFNILGLPATAVPVGMHDGLPVAIQVAPPSPALNGSSPPPAPARHSGEPKPAATPPAPATGPDSPPATPPESPATPTQPAPTNNNDDTKLEDLYDIPVGSPVPPEKLNNNGEEKKQVDVEKTEKEKDKANDSPKTDEVYDIPVGATLAGLPAGVLYRVRATYRYTREDSDELSFDVGDTIRVVEYDDPEEQEEGWLMGIKEGTNEKGMFPANFTRPI